MDARLGLFDIVGGEVDFLAVFVEEGRGGGEFESVGDRPVEADFGLDAVASHVGLELFNVAGAFGDGAKVADEVFGAFVAGGVEPFGLVGEDEVSHFFPVALEAGSFNSGGGGDGVRVERGDGVDAEDDGELAVIFG